MRKIKKPSIGEYVLVSRWSDHDPHDPWYIGFVNCILQYKYGFRYKVNGSLREWPHVFRISKVEGAEWLKTNMA